MERTSLQQNSTKFPNFKDYLWYKANEKELLRQFRGRFLLIKNEQVLGDFDSRKAARLFALKFFAAGTFIIHQCLEENARLAPRLHGRRFVTIEEK